MIDQIITFLYGALFFVTPLLMSKSTSELFEFNKMLFIYGSTVVIAFFWFYKMAINKKIILKKTPLDVPIIIFFLSQLISTVVSIDIHTSVFGYYGRFNGGLLSIVSYIILYYGLVSNAVNIKKLLKTILFSSLLVIVWAIPGHFGHDLTCLLFAGSFNNSCWDNSTLAFRPELRAFSTLGQPNWLGAYLAVAFFIGIYFLVKNKSNTKYFILNTLYLFLNFSMILMSRSRSAIGAVVIGLMLFIGYYFLVIKNNSKKLLITLLLVTLLPIIFFKTGEDKIDKYISILNIKDQISKIQIKNQKEEKNVVVPLIPNRLVPSPTLNITESFDIRKIVWEGAWKLALKYPLFGTGVETFAYSYNFVRPVAHNLTSEWDYVYNKAHNEYFNFLATTGFVGLGAYLLLIFNFQFSIFNQFLKFKFLNNEKSVKNEKFKMQIEENKFNEQILIVTLSIAYITILITNFFGFSTTTTQLFFFLIPALVFSITDSFGTDAQFGRLYKRSPITLFQKILITLLTIISIYSLFSITVYYLADVEYSYGLKYSKINDQQKAAQYFEKALKLRQEPVYLDKLSSALAYLSALANVQNQAELSKEIYNISDTYNKKTIRDFPKNVFFWKTRAKNMYYFYLVTGKEKELLQGIDALTNAQILAPTDPKIPYSLALYHSMLFDLTKNYSEKQNWQKLSLEEINKVVELKSNYREGYLLKGQLLKKYGLNTEAKQVFEFMLKNFDAKDQDVLKEIQTL